jgi:hypothetical protein
MKCEFLTEDGKWCIWAGQPCEKGAHWCVKEAGESE